MGLKNIIKLASIEKLIGTKYQLKSIVGLVDTKKPASVNKPADIERLKATKPIGIKKLKVLSHNYQY